MKPKSFGRYEIRTVDPEQNRWTHQTGCPPFVSGFAGLREACRKLIDLGYGFDSDMALIQRVDKPYLDAKQAEFESLLTMIGDKS